jgi:di/tricarboxylate transporter
MTTSNQTTDTGPGVFKAISGSRDIIFWALTILLPVIILMIPVSDAFTPELRLFFAITTFAICLWAFETIHFLIPSLFLPVLYLLFDLAPPDKAFFAWSIDIPWLLVGGMILTGIFEDAGLLKRISYWCILRVGGSYRGILYGLMLSGVGVALVLPDIASRVIMYTALSYGICKSLKLEPKTKESAGIMLAGVVAALTPAYAYLTSAAQTLIVYDIAGRSGIEISWLQYLLYNGFPTLVWCLGSVFLLDILFKSGKAINVTEQFDGEIREMGPMSGKEKKFIAVLVLIFLAVVTNTYHKVSIGWIFTLAACVCYFPGINIGRVENLQKVNYPLVIFVVSCLTIGMVSNVLGAGKFIADTLYPYIAGGQLYTMVSSWALAVVLNFVMTPLAAVSSVTDPLVQIIQTSGLSPIPILYAWNQGLEQIILPYEYALVLFAFGFGYISLKHLIQYFSLRMLFNLIFLVVICVPFWKLIGIF